jgi:hypothetical protein
MINWFLNISGNERSCGSNSCVLIEVVDWCVTPHWGVMSVVVGEFWWCVGLNMMWVGEVGELMWDNVRIVIHGMWFAPGPRQPLGGPVECYSDMNINEFFKLATYVYRYRAVSQLPWNNQPLWALAEFFHISSLLESNLFHVLQGGACSDDRFSRMQDGPGMSRVLDYYARQALRVYSGIKPLYLQLKYYGWYKPNSRFNRKSRLIDKPKNLFQSQITII